jgi:hypothetical protein
MWGLQYFLNEKLGVKQGSNNYVDFHRFQVNVKPYLVIL